MDRYPWSPNQVGLDGGFSMSAETRPMLDKTGRRSMCHGGDLRDEPSGINKSTKARLEDSAKSIMVIIDISIMSF